MESALRQSDNEAKAVQKTPHRITLDSMESKVESVEYIRPASCPKLTLAIVSLYSGYVLVGKSAPVDEGNFDEALGQKFAREDAIRQMWPLEGYALREQLPRKNSP